MTRITGPQALGVKMPIEDDGQAGVLSMTLVRTHHQDEGHTITELIIADGSHWFTYGTFEIKPADEEADTDDDALPIVLSTSTDLPLPLNDRADAKQLADQLMALLVEHGEAWGLKGWEPCS